MTRAEPIRVLLAASEVVGFAKTGGLADVAGALPPALARRGCQAAVILPLYRCARTGKVPVEPTDHVFRVPIGGRSVQGRLWRSRLPGSDVPVYLVEHGDYFDRDDPATGRGLYQFKQSGELRDYPDNCRALRLLLPGRPGSLPPARLLARRAAPQRLADRPRRRLPARGLPPLHHRRQGSVYDRVKTLFTIHNIAYQGVFWHWDMTLAGLIWRLFNPRQLEFHGHLNFLKAGARLQRPAQHRQPDLCPRDPDAVFRLRVARRAERTARSAVRHRQRRRLRGLGPGARSAPGRPLRRRPSVPRQAGVQGGAAAAAGSGRGAGGAAAGRGGPAGGAEGRRPDRQGRAGAARSRARSWSCWARAIRRITHMLQDLRKRLSRAASACTVGFDEALAHQIEAGADLFLMPSLYEPSGLNQLYSMRYGTPPVVRATGGLADTVVDATPADAGGRHGDGLQLHPLTGRRPCWTRSQRGIDLYREQSDGVARRGADGHAAGLVVGPQRRGVRAAVRTVEGDGRRKLAGASRRPLRRGHTSRLTPAVRRRVKGGRCMADIALAFLWHQHQPYYPDDVAGENPMPWVRLHGVKDYYGMALHLLEFPEMRCTINLVPSLLRAAAGLHRARRQRPLPRRVAHPGRRPERGGLPVPARPLLHGQPEHMIRPFPRYAELYQRRGAGSNTAAEALRRFSERDLRDLQVLVQPRLDPSAGLRARRRPARPARQGPALHRGRQGLRCSTSTSGDPARDPAAAPAAGRARPGRADHDAVLPSDPAAAARQEAGPRGDAGRQAAALHRRLSRGCGASTFAGPSSSTPRLFGKPPRGMWPAEGSVCQSMIPLLAQHGIRWIATDEEILSASTHGFVSRDGKGHVRNPELLYRPYKVREGDAELGIVFRDHALSDMIGFHYQRSEPAGGGRRLRRQSARHRPGGRRRRAGPGQRHPRRRELLGALSRRRRGRSCARCTAAARTTPGVEPVSHRRLPGAASAARHAAAPVRRQLDQPQLRHLDRPRGGQHRPGTPCTGHARAPAAEAPSDQRRQRRRRTSCEQAWEELYIAEGSDWFWWYGDDHSSAQDALFDYLFRKHLQNVYLLLGDAPPPDLAGRSAGVAAASIHTLPRAFLDVKIDGRATFFEWLSAGRYTCQNERGTMAMATHGPLQDVYFGFDLKRLLVRVDCDEPAAQALADYDALRIGFVEPAGCEICASTSRGTRGAVARAGRRRRSRCRASPVDRVGVDQIVGGGDSVRRCWAWRSTSRCSSSWSCCRTARAATGRRARAPSP